MNYYVENKIVNTKILSCELYANFILNFNKNCDTLINLIAEEIAEIAHDDINSFIEVYVEKEAYDQAGLDYISGSIYEAIDNVNALRDLQHEFSEKYFEFIKQKRFEYMNGSALKYKDFY